MKITRQKLAAKSDLRRFVESNKRETVITGPVERMLLTRAPEDRRSDVLHPSELAKNSSCDLAIYYRVLGMPVLSSESEKPSFQLQRIFDQGTEIHLKWQGYLTECGLLEGTWECRACEQRFWGCAPKACPACAFPAPAYREVPFDAFDSHLIMGHADGKIGRRILEIKSIGIGTIRIEAPGLLAQHSYRTRLLDEEGALTETEKLFVDWEGLWKSIKRPLNSHQRQAHLYTALAKMQDIDVDGVVFLYESKWNQSAKEFVVPYNPKIAEPLLERALDLKYAVEKGKPPRCPHGGCNDCRKYEPEHNEEQRAQSDEAPAQRGGGDGRSERRSGGSAGEAGSESAPTAGRPASEGARQPLGARRRSADGALRPTDRVGGLSRGATRSG